CDKRTCGRELKMSRRRTRASCLALAFALLAAPAGAQTTPTDLTAVPTVKTAYTPPKTAWGDYDISHTYQYEYFNAGRILFQRPAAYGNRAWVTDEEFARRLAAAEKSDAAYSPEGQGINYPGSQ